MFQKGRSGNPKGRPPGRSPSQMVIYDLKEAARKHCPEALEIVLRCLRSEDGRVALRAAEILFERAYGRPEQQSDLQVNHKFVIAPNTLPIDEWLATKGQGERNEWLERQQRQGKPEGPMIDLKAEQPELESPPTPPVDPSKLN